MLTANYHIHSHYSPCAGDEMTLDAILDAAEDARYDAIGITDHCYGFDLDTTRIAQLRRELHEAADGRTLKAYLGLEAYVLRNGVTSVTPQIAALFDYVIVAPNHYHIRGVAQPIRLDPRLLADHELYMLEAAVNSPVTDVVAHPFVLSPYFCRLPDDHLARLSRQMLEAVDEKRLVEILDRAQARHVAMEVNAKIVRYGQEHLRPLFRLCVERGVKLAIGTDAHELEHIAPTPEFNELINAIGPTEADLWRPLAFD